MSDEASLQQRLQHSIAELKTHEIELRMQNDELRRVQRELETSRQDFFNLFMLAPVAYFILSAKGRIEKTNYEGEKFVGSDREVIVGAGIHELVRRMSHQALELAIYRVIESEVRQEVELTLSDGRRVLGSFSPYFRANSSTPQVLVTLQDISRSDEMHRQLSHTANTAQDQARVASGLLDATLQAVADALIVTDRYGRILEWRFESSFKSVTHSDILAGLTMDEVFDRTVGLGLLDQLGRVGRTRKQDRKVYVLEREGSKNRYLDVVTVSVGNRFVFVMRQIERPIEEESEVLRTERLNMIGTLAASLAHQFNNIHHPMIAHLDEIERLNGDEQLETHVTTAKLLGSKAAALTRSILGFARDAEPVMQDVRVKDIVDQVMLIVGDSLADQGMDCRIEVAPEIFVKGDNSQLEQVVLNLIMNALHASLDSETKQVLIKASITGNRCQLTIADQGMGIDKADFEKIFDPLFTTKGEFSKQQNSALSKVKGTGLGLSLCRQIVEAHKGSILVKSSPGKGATFVVELPVSFFPSQQESAGTGASASPTDVLWGKRVLLVDDSKFVRAITGVYLERGGMRVEQAEDGREALEKCREQKFDLILTDWRMPVMSGEEFILALGREQLQPTAPVIVVSAVEELETIRDEDCPNGRRCHFLGKPFTEPVLHHRLAEILIEAKSEPS